MLKSLRVPDKLSTRDLSSTGTPTLATLAATKKASAMPTRKR